MRKIFFSNVIGLILISSILAGPSFVGRIFTVKRSMQSPATVAEGIRTEAIAASSNETDRPLPLAAHWNLGEAADGFSPNYQMQMIDQGHYLFPWFLMPNIHAQPDDPRWLGYYEAAIKRAAQLKLPISFVGTQWEIDLSVQDEYLNLPPDKNPNVVTVDGRVERKVSPFGPVAPWQEVGIKWGSTSMLKKIQEWYPDPPLVMFVSNNEHPKLEWIKVEEDRRYLKLFGAGRDDNFKRKVVADGWIERYRALQRGIREGLTNKTWKDQAIFIGYDAFGPSHFARWPGWLEFSLYSPGRIAPWPLAWDGASPSFYVFNWSSITDYTMFSPQVEAMNWAFMLKEARRLNPKFWFEISIWDGHLEGESDKRQAYARAGQQFTPERYGGMAQFGMWLLRPRVVREFRGYLETLTDEEPYFLPIVNAVDRVHKNPVLTEFWRRGELVPNRTQSHPYQALVPAEYQNLDRWFLLDTSLDPKRPWELGTELPVFSLALVKGAASQRQWLLYAHSPLGPRPEVKISIPNYREVTVKVPVGGAFYLVDEKSSLIQEIN
ncbi:MAG TPA: hypothetical protein VJ302_22675 [Blastocatellia bacterium]|nr:hypothetical protein [Blastocatellia bacterium]